MAFLLPANPATSFNIGLYMDGLVILDQTPKETDKIFAKTELKITIEANKKVANYLDVTLETSSRCQICKN